jgi:hypothetical protein
MKVEGGTMARSVAGRILSWGIILVPAALVALLVATNWKALFGEREGKAPSAEPRRRELDAAGNPAVKMDPASRERIGLRVEALKFVDLPAVKTAYGKVLSPEPLLALHGEISAAEAALKASGAEYERTKKLHEDGQGTSLKAVESAEAQFRADEVRVKGAALRLRSGWGKEISALSSSEREELLERMAREEAFLARVSLPAAESLPGRPAKAVVEIADVAISGSEGPGFPAGAVYEAPTVDDSLRGRGFILRMEGKDLPFRPGATVLARLEVPGKTEKGALIPSSAIVRFEGKSWAYVEAPPESFARMEILRSRPAQGGWFAPEGFSRGESVVVLGAQALLSEELRLRIQLEEEGEEGEEKER